MPPSAHWLKQPPETIEEILDAIRSLDCWGCGCCSWGSWHTTNYGGYETKGDKEYVRTWLENLVSKSLSPASRAVVAAGGLEAPLPNSSESTA